MSLDVYLTCEHCGNCAHDSNITHNLGEMADKAGIYMYLWRPEELGITKAKQLIEPLKEGLEKLKNNREYYEQFNSPNGWGLYEHFVPWVEAYLESCISYPECLVRVSR